MSDISSYPDYVWWLSPGRLAGMPRPPLEDLPVLYQAGMRGIVSVMDEPSNIEEYQDGGFQALWLPITGGKSPTVEQVLEFVQFADSFLEQNQVVAVHCTSGNRRTGTLLAAYLIVSGKSSEQAIMQVQQARPSAQLRDAQKQFLYALPDLLA
ncbi:MAG: dual specificity protein phosphatase family protein [Cyanobacteria bacterium P01_G01_bin.49]